MRILFICLIFGSAQISFAYSERMGLPCALELTQPGLWSAAVNPAALSGLDKSGLGLASARPYLLPEVHVSGFMAGFPIKSLAVMGLHYTTEGTVGYRASSWSMLMAKSFAQKVNFGMAIRYMQTVLGNDYGRGAAVAADMGIQVKWQPRMTLGMVLSNPTRARRSKVVQERYPTCISSGLGYRFTDKLIVSAVCSKTLTSSAQLAAGCEYQPTPQILFKAGFEGGQGLFYFGMGWKVKQWQLDLLSRMHQQLGQSPMFSITYLHVPKVSVPICFD